MISNEINPRETVVTENGKVIAGAGAAVASDNLSASSSEYGSQFYALPLDYFEIKNNRPLRLKRKLYEFYSAPITKFWANSVSFLISYCYNFFF